MVALDIGETPCQTLHMKRLYHQGGAKWGFVKDAVEYGDVGWDIAVVYLVYPHGAAEGHFSH